MSPGELFVKGGVPYSVRNTLSADRQAAYSKSHMQLCVSELAHTCQTVPLSHVIMTVLPKESALSVPSQSTMAFNPS